MTPLLEGLRIVEYTAFIAAPLAGLTLAQLGAEVIRVDPVGGNVDIDRWPLTAEGRSLYWAGLNKGKRSVEIDVRSAEGRGLLRDLILSAGAFLTNLPVPGELGWDALSAARPDLLMLVLEGSSDGTTAVDYTVNCAAGYPLVTGPATPEAPVNHVFPAWDAVAGLTLATGLLAAERRRLLTGRGELIRLALSDAAFAMVGNLGHLAEVEVNGRDRPALGNDLYGAFGRDFGCADGRRVMVVAVTPRQWRALVQATGTGAAMAAIAAETGLDLDDEGARFRLRDRLAAALAPWFAARPLDGVRAAFAGTAVCWGPYQSFSQLLAEDPRCSEANPVFARVDHPGIGPHLTPGTPLRMREAGGVPPAACPRLGQDTAAVLSRDLGLGADRVASLRAAGIIGSPDTDP